MRNDVVQILVDASTTGALYALAALGIGLVFGSMRLANFAHGELITACSYSFVLTWHLGAVASLVITLAVGIGTALLCELVVFRKLRGAHPATLLIASFALSFLLQRTYEMIFGNNVRSASVAPELAQSLDLAGIRVQWLTVLTMVMTVGLLLGLRTFLSKTSVGLHVRAASIDFEAAQLMGVRADRVIASTFAISGILAAAVAFVMTAQSGAVGPTFGVNITILALVGAVIGGVDKLGGAVLGGFLVGSSASLLSAWLPSTVVEFRDAFVFVLVLLVLLVRPGGLLQTTAVQRA